MCGLEQSRIGSYAQLFSHTRTVWVRSHAGKNFQFVTIRPHPAKPRITGQVVTTEVISMPARLRGQPTLVLLRGSAWLSPCCSLVCRGLSVSREPPLLVWPLLCALGPPVSWSMQTNSPIAAASNGVSCQASQTYQGTFVSWENRHLGAGLSYA